MKAVHISKLKVNDDILVDVSGDKDYTVLSVEEVHEDHVIVNMNFGTPCYPNIDNCYIVVNYQGEESFKQIP